MPRLLSKTARQLFTTLIICIAAIGIANAASKCARCYKRQTITISEVHKAQRQWARGIVAIGNAYTQKGNYRIVARKMIKKLYAYNYDQGIVLFKPTKAKQHPFRDSFSSALSYFVGGNGKFKEDTGFALEPWTKVKFDNNEIFLHANTAIAMGEYYFTCSKGTTTKVEYTLGYIKTKSGALKIFLQHSSLPYSG